MFTNSGDNGRPLHGIRGTDGLFSRRVQSYWKLFLAFAWSNAQIWINMIDEGFLENLSGEIITHINKYSL